MAEVDLGGGSWVETAEMNLVKSLYAIASIFPSMECVDERQFTWGSPDPEEMVLTGPPV